MASLRIDIPDDKDINAVLKNVYGLLADPTPILDEASAVLLSRVRRNFLTQTAPDGTQWEPSHAATLREKAGKGGGTLFASGRLFHSIQLFSISTNERSIGSDVPYGGFHNFGTSRLPARVWLGFSEEDARIAEQVGIKLFTEAMNS